MRKFISIFVSALLLLNLTSAFAMAQTQETTSIYTEAKKKEVSAGEDFEFEIYLSGTYDGYAINVSTYSGTEIKNIVPADKSIKIDKGTDVWVISTMPGLEFVDSEKALIATVTVSTSDLVTGELLLSLAKVNITNDSGDRINDYGSHFGTIVINEKLIPITGFTLDKTTATVETSDEPLTLTPIFSPENATNKNLTWTSDNESIATVENGVVTLIKKGVVTITATTEDGGYTASCVVTINCSHTKVNFYPAESSTCIQQGHGAYDVCEECGEIINGSDAKLPFADHTYVEQADAQYLKTAATCNSKAVYYKSCSVCGVQSETSFFEYGEFDNTNHVGGTYKVNQKEATCYEEGYTGDIYCAGCNTKLETGTVIEKNAHNPASVWSTDENYHWKDCQSVGCGNIIDKAAHNGGEATCVNKAICSVCGVEYGTVNEENHKNTELRNVKSATEEETGYTGDRYCKDCEKIIEYGMVIPVLDHTHAMTHYNAVEATCKTEGNVEYWHCSKCNKNYADESGTTELLAVVTPINPDNHSGGTKTVSKKDADCEASGYTGDTVCNGCGEIIIKGTEVSPLGHKVQSTDWHTDSTNHWHECTVCNKKLDIAVHKGGTATCKDKAVCTVCGQPYGTLAEHTYIEKSDAKHLKSAATCISRAVYYKSCSECGIAGTETFEYGEFDMNNHVGATYIKDQKEATCYEEGYTGDTYCGDCNVKIKEGTVIEKSSHNPSSVWSTDDNYHWKTCQTVGCGNIIDKAEHSGGTADCSHKAICEVCGVEYGTVNADKHKNTEIRNAIDATCTADGYTGDVYCKDCGVKITDGTVIPAVGHKLNKIEAKDATHETDGNIEYYVCSVCGKLFRDAKATTEITLEDTVIAKGEHNYGDSYKSDAESHWKECVCGNATDKSAHTFGEWSVIKAATETEKGIKEKICSVCGYKVTEDLPVLPVENNTDNNEAENPTDKPATAVHQTDRVESPETGADNNFVTYIALLGISGFALIVTTIRRKKRAK